MFSAFYAANVYELRKLCLINANEIHTKSHLSKVTYIKTQLEKITAYSLGFSAAKIQLNRHTKNGKAFVSE
jgi:hypothetical protein